MRWVVGDVQGCVRELERLVEAIDFDPSRDELWSVGDLVNRGPDSLAVLRLWRDIGGSGVLGNHDVYALRADAGTRRRKRDTLDALLAAPDVDQLLEPLRGWPLLARLRVQQPGRETWLVHAGLHPLWSDLPAVAARINTGPRDAAWLDAPDTRFATRVRCCTAAGRLSDHSGPPAGCPKPCRPWDDFYGGEALIVHGHWARRGHYRRGSTLGLDSGCVYGGPLTAWNAEEDRIVQVAGYRP